MKTMPIRFRLFFNVFSFVFVPTFLVCSMSAQVFAASNYSPWTSHVGAFKQAAAPVRPMKQAAVLQRPYVAGEVLVKFKMGASALNINNLKNTLGARKIKNIGRTGMTQFKVRPGLSVEAAMLEYQNQPEVESVQPNYIYHQAFIPNDTDFINLWGMHNTGQTVETLSGVVNADIDAPKAWDITTGSAAVVVAVIDAGVDYNHPDISANIWNNTGETAANITDDDLNGFVDDVRGWDFVDADNTPMDVSTHGTHVAGTIGAVGNNGMGVAGVAWSSKIMPIRVLDALGSGTTANIASGIDYAVNNGAKIINISITTAPGAGMDFALQAAIGGAKTAGVLIVAAAGNQANNNDLAHVYPSDYTDTNIISVAATNQYDQLASFSNYGAFSVDVAAPGTNIYSLQPARQTVFSEDFETGLTGWVNNTASGNAWGLSTLDKHTGTTSLDDGSGAANYPINNNATITSPTFSLVGKTGCKLSVWGKFVTEPGWDFFTVRINAGAGFVSLPGSPFSGNQGAWSEAKFDLKPYQGSATVNLELGLTSNGSNQFSGVSVDDILVTCSSTTFAGTEYYFNSGTSMAAPHVSGLAALLLAQNPSLGVTQLKSLIVSGGDYRASLVGKTVSGKRINAFNALAIAGDTTPPVITLIGDNPMTIIEHVPYMDPGSTTTDNVSNNLTALASGTVNFNEVGVYTVSYNVSDAAGNAAATVTRKVIVEHAVVTPPVIAASGGGGCLTGTGSSGESFLMLVLMLNLLLMGSVLTKKA